MAELLNLLRTSPVMPVLVIDRLADAVPLAHALVAGGIRTLEVTLRTDCAWDAIAAIRAEVGGAVLAVGTVTRPEELSRCAQAGVDFAVSPGLTTTLALSARQHSLPLLPGVMTPSEVMSAREAGFSAMKLFPAEQAGGLAMLKALGGPLPDVTFCPTGGISAQSAPSFLALPNVACVGGSWLAPRDLVQAGRWSDIEALAREAAALRA